MPGDSRPAIIASVAANVAIAITKFVVGMIARSTAMIAEAVHSLANCFDGGLLLLGQHLAQRPPDRAHPFGHAREVYFWSLIVAIVFFALGAGFTVYDGVHRIVHPSPLGDPKWSYIVLAAAAVFDGGSFVIGFRQFRRHTNGRSYWRTVRESKNPALFSVVLEDAADLIGLALAFLGVFLSHRLTMPWLDGLASIAIGAVIGSLAVILLVETHGLLIGEAARPTLIDAICRLVESQEGVMRVSYVGSLHIGPRDIVVALKVEFDPALGAADLAHRASVIEERVRREHRDVGRLFLEPAAPDREHGGSGTGSGMS